MSSFEQYDTTCHNYDNLRHAIGSDVVAGMIPFYCGKPLSDLHVLDAGCGTGNYTKALLDAGLGRDLHVLDAGCGTGNYTKALLDAGLGRVSMLDASPGMLEKARAKLVQEIKAGRVVDITQATLPKLPYPDSSFDAVFFNLVLHHLQPNPDGENYPLMNETIAEARRVLKKDGVLVIGTCFPDTYIWKLWYTKLCEPITHRFMKLFPKFEHVRTMLDTNNLELLSKLVVYQPSSEKIKSAIMDPMGPTKKAWRDINSYWAVGTEEEIIGVEKKVVDMKKDGTLETFVKENNTLDYFYSLEFIFASPV